MKHLGLFAHFVKVKMNEIMEQKLPIIWSKYIEFDPLVNVDYVESYTRNIEGTNQNTSETEGNEKVKENRTQENTGTTTSKSVDNSSGLIVNSDTPQRSDFKTSNTARGICFIYYCK